MFETNVLTPLITDLENIIDNSNQFSLGDLTAKEFIELEAGLYLLHLVMPNEPVESLSFLLCLYDLPHEGLQNLSTSDRHKVRKASYLLPVLRSTKILSERLDAYQKIIPQYLRWFPDAVLSAPIQSMGSGLLATREQDYHRIFNNGNLDIYQENDTTVKYARPDQHYLSGNPQKGEDVKSYKIPEDDYNLVLNRLGINPTQGNPIQQARRKSQLPGFNLSDLTQYNNQKGNVTYTKAELMETACWMDEQLINKGKSGKYERILNKTFWQCYDGTPDETLHLDGTVNLVGMVNAGKSTLAKIVAVHQAKHNLRTTLVFGSVMECKDVEEELNIFLKGLNQQAATIIGVSNRYSYTSQIHNSVIRRQESLDDSANAASLSTICLLDNYLDEEDFHVLESAIAPCNNLRSPSRKNPEEPSTSNWMCPFFHVCPSKQGDLAVIDSIVWITTPQALLKSNVPRQLIKGLYKVKYGELIYIASSLIIFDESDNIQVYFDSEFCPNLHLFGKGETPVITRLISTLNKRNQETNRGHLFRKPQVENWQVDIKNADNLANRILPLLDDTSLENWLVDSGFFKSSQLFTDVAKTLSDLFFPGELKNQEILEAIFNVFTGDSINDSSVLSSELLNKMLWGLKYIARIVIDKEAGLVDIVDWIESLKGLKNVKIDKETRTILSKKLYLAILFTQLSDCIQSILFYAPYYKEIFDIDPDISFFKSSDEFSRVLPSSPIISSGQFFKYTKDISSPRIPGKLDVINFSGVGRHLLYNYHNLFTWNNIPGCNVLLMSGTSWAGTSSKYHLQIPVNIVLRPDESSINTIINESKTSFEPSRANTSQPIKVSGNSNKQEALEQIAIDICKVQSNNKTKIDNWIDRVAGDRKRALLLVGSYADSAIVAAALQREYNDKNVKIVALGRDSNNLGDDIDFIQRSDVSRFAEIENAKILIAPILAVERGHNILNAERVAAFGVVVFLARPFPVPNDPLLLIGFLNAWALDALDSEHPRYVFKEKKSNNPSLASLGNKYRTDAKNYCDKIMGLPIQYSKLTATPELDLRSDIASTLRVMITQVVGRAVRGGVSFHLYFVDSAFAPKTAQRRISGMTDSTYDSAASSLLVAIADEAMKYKDNSVGSALYKPFDKSLIDMMGDSVDVKDTNYYYYE
ncbi:hypothetical protein [Okeania sp.]|uniref:pPIWI_RE_Z domain-containing protein n=1 Tax=Okeania sp. TaxID=3100323 RepID=UPI002B4ABC7B|nr:hypothetical protein [Okeania sp.]MEB3341708.1 hypothetical protein [Okeania sp.]